MTGSGPDDKRTSMRRELRARRLALPVSRRFAAAEALPGVLSSFEAARSPGYVAGYWASNGELPLHVVQLRLPPDQSWCLPLVQPDRSLRFAPWRPGDPLVTNRYGIPEPDVAMTSTLGPEDMHLVLLPLLGFDRHGRRLGMGGGYYDRSFGFRRDRGPAPWLVGIGYSEQEMTAIPDQAWDVSLDAIATDAGLVLPTVAGAGR